MLRTEPTDAPIHPTASQAPEPPAPAPSQTIGRRALLAASAAAAGAAGVAMLAGCSKDAAHSAAAGGTAPERSGVADSADGAAAATGGSSGAATGGGNSGAATGTGSSGAATGGATSSAAAGSGGVAIAKVADVPVGNAIAATLSGKPVLVSQPSAGTVVAFSAICTHMGCTVAPAGREFHCPCHGSVYDAATGAVKKGPAPAPLPKIPTHVVDGEVMSGA